MSITGMVDRGRTLAEGLMVDTGTITRGGVTTFDPITGLLTVTGTVVHTGSCRVRQPNVAENQRLFGEEQVTSSRFIVDFPHDVTGVRIDDVITITASDDADLLTRRFRVMAVPMMTYPIYKGFPCESVE